MANSEIIQNLIVQPGQSQDQRLPKELDIHFAKIDERTDEELLLFAKNFAEFVKFYSKDSGVSTGDWSAFFPGDIVAIRALLANKSGNLTPHQALFISFLRLYLEGPQKAINNFTGKHLDFYYKDILHLTKKQAVADKAHLVLELKKNATPILITPDVLFTAGIDKNKVDLTYAPTRETVINTCQVDSVRSIYYDQSGHGVIRYAPIADSADGIGAPLAGEEPKWMAFGTEKLPPLEVGFAFSSPVLRMKEGERNVSVTINLENLDTTKINNASLKNSMELFVTGEKGWIGPFDLSPIAGSDSSLSFDFTLPESEKAVVDYKPSLHGYQYSTQLPVIQILIKTDSATKTLGYNDIAELKIKSASISVDVSGVSSLQLENDFGRLDPKKPFAPFGQQPTKGAHFQVGYSEALAKQLTEISLDVKWKNPPANLGTHYSSYGITVNNNSFTSAVDFSFGHNQHYSENGVTLFNAVNANALNTLLFKPGRLPHNGRNSYGGRAEALMETRSKWSSRILNEYKVANPVQMKKPYASTSPEGFLNITLNSSFFHAEYQKKSVENIVNFAKGAEGAPAVYAALNEPYTPVIQSISLSYQAKSALVNLNTNSLDDFTNGDLQFFHVTYFGQMREHTYQRNQFNYLTNKSVALFPEYRNEGELLIGFRNLKPGDSVSVLFQVAEGSEDPDLEQAAIQWSTLSDNYWKPLSTAEVVLDTTNQLLQSGIVQFVLPEDATLENTIMPADLIWIRAAIAKNIKAVCQLVAVEANAIEVQFRDSGNDPAHLASPLEKGKITKPVEGIPLIKTVNQPFNSFGGKQSETDPQYYTRSAERLRHKNRSITIWDYERMILEEFPGIHKVKCIPHARYNADTNSYCWLAPGGIVLVVIPDLKNKNAVDPLSPKADSNTIRRITDFVAARAGMQVKVKVKNPYYQKIMLEFKVKFHPGYEFNFYSEKLKEQLKQFLSPWAYASERDITFGGKIYKSVLLDFVEELKYVDYIEDFYLFTINDFTGKSGDLNEIQPDTPDTILVSNHTHIIHKI